MREAHAGGLGPISELKRSQSQRGLWAAGLACQPAGSGGFRFGDRGFKESGK